MKVELINTFGNDDMVVDVARVSYNKIAKNYTQEANDKLLAYLVEHKHISPFFHPKLQFRLQMPIYVERQIIKTSVGVDYNSISGRYVDFSDSYTTIDIWRKQATSSKQGSSKELVENQEECNRIQEEVLRVSRSAYKALLALGVAKEQARTILPLNLNTEQIWTGSLGAFVRLCSLRLKDDAQKETRDLVALMLDEVIKSKLFPVSLKAFKLC